MFVPFGQSELEVRSYLDDKEYIMRVDEIRNENKIRSIMEYFITEYSFKDNQLYTIKATKYYPNKRAAQEAIQASLMYMKLLKGEFLEVPSYEWDHHYVIIEEERLIELKHKRYDSYHELELSSTSRLHGPRSRTETLAMQLLEKKR